MHIAYKEVKESSGAISDREKMVIDLIKANPQITLAQISDKIGRSLRTVNNTIKALQEKGIIERVGGKKNGRWQVK
jgi:DNA-binding Lrp family transcriptional regulator